MCTCLCFWTEITRGEGRYLEFRLNILVGKIFSCVFFWTGGGGGTVCLPIVCRELGGRPVCTSSWRIWWRIFITSPTIHVKRERDSLHISRNITETRREKVNVVTRFSITTLFTSSEREDIFRPEIIIGFSRSRNKFDVRSKKNV